MTPLTQDPRLNVLLNPDNGQVVKTSTNVAPDLQVRVTYDPKEFAEFSRGEPFENEVTP